MPKKHLTALALTTGILAAPVASATDLEAELQNYLDQQGGDATCVLIGHVAMGLTSDINQLADKTGRVTASDLHDYIDSQRAKPQVQQGIQKGVQQHLASNNIDGLASIATAFYVADSDSKLMDVIVNATENGRNKRSYLEAVLNATTVPCMASTLIDTPHGHHTISDLQAGIMESYRDLVNRYGQ
ncbi:MAG: hypothetical protein AWU57_597 [Marinobacter sp. T13-3]|nr:MAG: hypothetical protein AWU57_597 [Marinobacter sp. T13-3]